MNTPEKLEQSSIIKEKGTQYFKVDFFYYYYSWNQRPCSTLMFCNLSPPYVTGWKIQAGVCAVQKDSFMART